MAIFFGWIIFSIIVGAIGGSRKIGFAGAFFLSLILSPLIGLIITLSSKDIEDEKYKEKLLENQKRQTAELANLSQQQKEVPAVSIADEIEKLKKLKEEGTISEEEYAQLRTKIIQG
jgi:uncharacterized membrane protein YraQ (UPF0718 family)